MSKPLRFKIADESSEFDQVHRLNYDTFVEEIPQHAPNAERRLVDKFHGENTYLLATDGSQVVGMLAVRGARPFSLDLKLGGVDGYLPAGRRPCELRLLAVLPSYRHGVVFRGLVDLLLSYGRASGYDLAIISGTLRQAKLYSHLGFVPFGPLVGTPEAPFQPMYITIERFEQVTPVLASPRRESDNFLTGPVHVSNAVQAAHARPPVSHRDAEFKDAFARTAARLRRLTGARHAQILLGSGTLANDVIAAQISLLDGPGVVLSNGEFGDRLIDQACRMSLDHVAVSAPWGEPLDLDAAARAIVRTRARWLWAVMSETSTGMLNDLDALKALARRHQVRLCLDCVSAIGAVPVDLDGVFLASGASGKALAALPGLAIVFHAAPVVPSRRLPRYLDLGHCAANDGIPFTHSSNLLAALEVALQRFESPAPFAEIDRLAAYLRRRLTAIGAPILIAPEQATPAVVTIPLPPPLRVTDVGDRLKRQGLVLAYQSEYLVRRNWLQVGLMGECSDAKIDRLITALHAIMASVAPAVVVDAGRQDAAAQSLNRDDATLAHKIARGQQPEI